MGLLDWLRPSPAVPPEIPMRTLPGTAITLPDTDPAVMARYQAQLRRWHDVRPLLARWQRWLGPDAQEALRSAPPAEVGTVPTSGAAPARARTGARAQEAVAIVGPERPADPPVSPAVTPEPDPDATPWLAVPARRRPSLDDRADELLVWLWAHRNEGSLYVLAKRWGWTTPGVHEAGGKAACQRLKDRGDLVKEGAGGSPLRFSPSAVARLVGR